MKKTLAVVVVLLIVLAGTNVLADDFDHDYQVTASCLNVRLGPGMQYDVFYKLYNGEQVKGKESVNGWTEINCYGSLGYVYSSYLREITQGATEETQTGNKTYLGNYKITGYNPYCAHCCGKSNGITASGAKAVVGQTIAMKGISFGQKVYIEGLGTYIVQDRGVGNGVIDVACGSHSECYKITGRYNVYLVD